MNSRRNHRPVYTTRAPKWVEDLEPRQLLSSTFIPLGDHPTAVVYDHVNDIAYVRSVTAGVTTVSRVQLETGTVLPSLNIAPAYFDISADGKTLYSLRTRDIVENTLIVGTDFVIDSVDTATGTVTPLLGNPSFSGRLGGIFATDAGVLVAGSLYTRVNNSISSSMTQFLAIDNATQSLLSVGDLGMRGSYYARSADRSAIGAAGSKPYQGTFLWSMGFYDVDDGNTFVVTNVAQSLSVRLSPDGNVSRIVDRQIERTHGELQTIFPMQYNLGGFSDDGKEFFHGSEDLETLYADSTQTGERLWTIDTGIENSLTKLVPSAEASVFTTASGKYVALIATDGIHLYSYSAAPRIEIDDQPVVGGTRVVVKATDLHGNIDSNFRGTVRFTSSDSRATLPEPYTFAATDAGVHEFDIAFFYKNRSTLSISWDGQQVVDTVTVDVGDGGRPQATFWVNDMTIGGSPILRVRVSGRDNEPMDQNEFYDAIVTMTGPDGVIRTGRYLAAESYQQRPVPGGPVNLQMMYAIDAPGGIWDMEDNGTYTVNINWSAVKDADGLVMFGDDRSTFDVNMVPFNPDDPNLPAGYSGTLLNVVAGSGNGQTIGQVGCHVYDDLNYNGIFDPYEPYAVTEYDGTFQIRVARGEHYFRAETNSMWMTPTDRSDNVYVNDSVLPAASQIKLYTTLANPVVIDLMIAYDTANTEFDYTDEELAARMARLVDEINKPFARSGTNVRINLVGTRRFEHGTSGKLSTDVTRLAKNKSEPFESIRTARDQMNADVVLLVVRAKKKPQPKVIGIAYTYQAKPELGYAAVYTGEDLDTTPTVAAHEIGHLLGAMHEKEKSKYAPFAQGYVFTGSDGYQYSDIMSTQQEEVQRLEVFSNPGITFRGSPVGVPNVADNARAIRNFAPIVAGYRGAPASMPPLRIDLAAISAGGKLPKTVTTSRQSNAFLTIANYGDGGYSAKATVTFYLSVDDLIDDSDIVVASTSRDLSIKPNKTAKVSGKLVLSTDIPRGDYKIIGVVSNASSTDQDLANNFAIGPTISFPVLGGPSGSKKHH